MQQLVNEKIVCEKIGSKVQTLRNHRHLCKGIPYIKIGRSVRYRLEDVEAYLMKHRIDPEA